jgi:hypothetical protein
VSNSVCSTIKLLSPRRAVPGPRERKPRKRRGSGRPKISGGYIEEAIPDPISNSEVKLFGADGTARATVWESRKLPG